jgi:1-acyl-sn-glycerol-3-phosphate acyltransferase
MIPIDRGNLQSAIESLNQTASLVIEEDRSIGISPEGTRRRSPSIGPDQLLPFKKGPFHLAKSTKSDIIPVAIIGANRLFPPNCILPKAGNYSGRH